MAGDSLTERHASSPAEIQRRLGAERAGWPFLLYRDGEGRQTIVELDDARDRLSIGRSGQSDVSLPWDAQVSRTHALLERLPDGWTLLDDGLSRNGTLVNGERVRGRRRLSDADRLRVGDTVLVFRLPIPSIDASTLDAPAAAPPVEVSPAQRRVLVALCRRFGEGQAFAAPLSNEEIAAELVLSLDAVKTHMRVLFQRFGLEGAPRGSKRVALVERAFQAGIVTESDYGG